MVYCPPACSCGTCQAKAHTLPSLWAIPEATVSPRGPLISTLALASPGSGVWSNAFSSTPRV
jgi:hypothetical protein